MITIDTSALLAGIDRTDPHHNQVVDMLESETGPIIIPVSILSEATFLIESSLGDRILVEFLKSLVQSQFILDCGELDLTRILNLVERYSDLPLGFADAAVIACAERHGGKVATLDLRHFGVVAAEGTIQVLP